MLNDVIQSVIRVGLFDRKDIAGRSDEAKARGVAAGKRAQGAKALIGQAAAGRAGGNLFLNFLQDVRQGFELILGPAEKLKSKPLSSPHPHPGEFFEVGD